MAENDPTDLGQLLTRLWESTRDRMIAAGQEPLTIRDIAVAVGATRAAVYLWFRGQRQPRTAALEKLAELFAADETHRLEIQARFLAVLEAQGRQPESAPPPAFLVSSGIAEREKYAAHLWILKWQKRFRSGSDAFLFNELVKIFANGDYGTTPKFHYVFPNDTVADQVAELESPFEYEIDKRREDLVAQRSFGYLEQQLMLRFPNLKKTDLENVIIKHEITSLADVLYLGIPRSDALAFFMFEYKATGYEKYGRWVDVFVEVDAKTDKSPERLSEVRADSSSSDGLLTYWVALPTVLSEQMRDNWKVYFEAKLKQSERRVA